MFYALLVATFALFSIIVVEYVFAFSFHTVEQH